MVGCTVCEIEYRPADIRMPSETPCPKCGRKTTYVRLPCDTCPAVELDTNLQNSQWAGLISRASDLDFMLNQPGAAVTLHDMTSEEFAVVQLIKTERDRYNQKRDTDARAKQTRDQHNRESRRR